MSLDTTFQTLLESKRSNASVVLANGIRRGDEVTRRRCIEALANRPDAIAHQELIRLWPTHREAIITTLDSRDAEGVAFFANVIKRLEDSDATAELIGVHTEIAATFHLISALSRLVEIAWQHPSREVRESTLVAVLSLCQRWGHEARRDYAGMRSSTTRERQRLQTMTRLQAAAQDFQNHRCEGLLDAFLMLGKWGDPSLQAVLTQDTPCRKIIVRRMRSSGNLGVMELLAGYFRRRQIPESLIGTVLQRSDAAYREILLRAISAKPTPTIINNLSEYGVPDCLRGGVEMLRQLGTDRDAAFAHVYSAAMNRNPETLLVLLEIIDRQSKSATAGNESADTVGVSDFHSDSLAKASALRQRIFDAVAVAMGRIEPPSIQFWLHAMNSPIMDGPATPRNDALQDLAQATDRTQSLDRTHLIQSKSSDPSKPTHNEFALDPQSDTAAVVCTGLVELVVGDEISLGQHAAELLGELNIHQVLPLFRKLSPIQRHRLGRVLMQIDSSTIDVIKDGLRHAVMQRRLEAIEFAQTLGLVDLMIEPLTTIALGDHQTARLAAAKALGHAHGETSMNLLRQLSVSEQPSVRDAAFASIDLRGNGE